MNVHQLRKILNGVPGHLEVILSRDPEGNGFSPLDDVHTENCGYDRENMDLVFLELTDDLIEQGYDHSDVQRSATPCVALWP